MAEAHIRLTCPCCNMVMSPSRLEQHFGVRFATVQFQGGGRGRGSCLWKWDAEIPDRDQLLAALRDKLARCLDLLDLEIGLLPEPFPLCPTSTYVYPIPSVQLSPLLRNRCGVAPMVRLNPIFSSN